MDKADNLTQELNDMIVLSDVSDLSDNDKMRRLADALMITSLKDIHQRKNDVEVEISMSDRMKANEQYIKFANLVEKRMAVDKIKKPKIADSNRLALGERRLRPMVYGDNDD